MSRSAATVSPGNANRRFIMLAIFLGLLGAVLVYVTFARHSGGTSRGSSADVPVVVAKQDIPARTQITASMVEVRLVPEDARSQDAYTDAASALNQVTRFPIVANEQVISTKLIPVAGPTTGASRSLSFIVPQGLRGMSILASEVQNAGGLLLPGDYVDVLVSFSINVETSPGDPGSFQKFPDYYVQTILQNKEVLAVSQGVVDLVPEATPPANGQRARNSEGKPDPAAATVTLALTPEEAQQLFQAETHGTIRLAVRHFGDGNPVKLDFRASYDGIPPNLLIPSKQ